MSISFRLARTLALLVVLTDPVAGEYLAALQGFGGRGPLGPITEPVPPRDLDRHQSLVETARAGNIDVLFVGDSITDFWTREGRAVWNEYFAPLNAANFGVAGDTVQGALWRMRNGELGGFQARLIILLLGTNNINRNRDADIVAGNRLLVEEFRREQPQARVLVLGLFPRGADSSNPYRRSIANINQGLAELADDEWVFYRDIGFQFLSPDGTLSEDVMPDALHPSAEGYRIWAEAMMPTVRELLQ